jgi:hypothetical protein
MDRLVHFLIQVAPGMSGKLLVSIDAKNDTEVDVDIKDEFKVVSEVEILTVPITASIYI